MFVSSVVAATASLSATLSTEWRHAADALVVATDTQTAVVAASSLAAPVVVAADSLTADAAASSLVAPVVAAADAPTAVVAARSSQRPSSPRRTPSSVAVILQFCRRDSSVLSQWLFIVCSVWCFQKVTVLVLLGITVKPFLSKRANFRCFQFRFKKYRLPWVSQRVLHRFK